MTGSGVDFYYKVGARLFVVALLHGLTSFHVSNVNKDLVAHRVYKGVFSVYICILFVTLLGLLSEGFELDNNSIELIGNGIGPVKLGFLSDCQVWWAWCRQFDS